MMHYIINPIKWTLLIAFLIFAITITSGLILIALLFGGIFIWYRSWRKKVCGTCQKLIRKSDTVCEYCNTIQ